MNIQKDVPFSLDDIDADWLTSALKQSGHLKSGEVTGLETRIIGEETGFLGQVAILTPSYSEDEAAPRSLVLKIPSRLKNRVMGQTMGVYEREIRFYSGLRDKLGIKTPEYYYSALSAADEPEVVSKRLVWLGNRPIWLIVILALVVQFVFSWMPRRYVLLIEDVSYLRLGDQEAGCSIDDMKATLRSMVRLHAIHWGSETVEKEIPWISGIGYSAKLIHLMLLQTIGKYKKETWQDLSERQRDLVNWVHVNGIRLSEELGKQPFTLLHHDMRLDNVCFNDETGEALFIDWQTMTFGSAGLELAYFLSSAMPSDVDQSTIDELIDYYHECLADEGVQVSPEYLRWSYEVGMLAMLHRMAPILQQGQFDLGSGRGPAVMQKWVDCIYHCLETVEFEGIFERRPDP